MRKILFRGFSPVIQEWVHGYYVKTQVGGKEICTIIPFDDLHKTLSEKRWFEVIPLTVGQYTGLTDKNGKKIFEGDACRFYGDEGYSDYVVFWDDTCSQWVVRQIDFGAKDVLDGFFSEHCEIIGNIHDNPELLEVDSRGKN